MTVGDKLVGYLLFMRKESYIDETIYSIIRDKMVLLFIAELWKEFDGWDGDPDTPTLEMKVVSLQDGDVAQITMITDDPKTYVKLDYCGKQAQLCKMGDGAGCRRNRHFQASTTSTQHVVKSRKI